MISELQRTQTILLTRLAALGAGGKLLPPVVTALANATTPMSVSSIPPVSSLSTSNAHSSSLIEGGDGVIPSVSSNNTTSKVPLTNGEEEDSVVIDVMHDSEDDNSSTTSGSDGGCTTTSHKTTLAAPLGNECPSQ